MSLLVLLRCANPRTACLNSVFPLTPVRCFSLSTRRIAKDHPNRHRLSEAAPQPCAPQSSQASQHHAATCAPPKIVLTRTAKKKKMPQENTDTGTCIQAASFSPVMYAKTPALCKTPRTACFLKILRRSRNSVVVIVPNPSATQQTLRHGCERLPTTCLASLFWRRQCLETANRQHVVGLAKAPRDTCHGLVCCAEMPVSGLSLFGKSDLTERFICEMTAELSHLRLCTQACDV